MSDDDDDDDLFGGGDESDDTADLIAASKKSGAAVAKKKTAAPPKKAPAKKAKEVDSDSDGGLFDSDSDDDDDDDDKKAAAAPSPSKQALSKRERLEALAKRKKGPEQSAEGLRKKAPSQSTATGTSAAVAKEKDGYDSEDTYDSATFERTAEDDNFIDTTGEDADAVNELYAEQNFRDERPDDEERKKKKKRRSDDGEENSNLAPDNPVMAAVHRMKKVKREKKSPIELEEEARSFIAKMDAAAVADEAAVAERRPALQKLSLLNEVCDTLKNKDMQRLLLDLNVLSVVRRWMAPLPNGTLGNVTVRQRLLDAIRNMTGEKGITANDLKESELGKTVMILYKHRSETPNMKRQWKALVEQWSRPIFQKSGNMRDLERVHGARGADGLAALARQQQLATRQQEQRSQQRQAAASEQDLDSLIASGKKGGTESGGNRVRVPFSKGFAFSVRPDSKAVGAGSPEKRSSGGGAKEDGTRSKLAKRMVEKNRLAGKNQRSANVSVEGRVSKG
jgi:transcription factor SPN1